MDVKYINPFISAVVNVLETMAFTKVEAGKPYLKKDNVAPGDVSGVVGLTGDVTGTVSISFSEASIIPIVSKMLGMDIKGLNDDVKDAVGEITNMVSGQARQELDCIGRSLSAAIPTVIMGKDHSLTHMTNAPTIGVPFRTSGGEFTILVCFEE